MKSSDLVLLLITASIFIVAFGFGLDATWAHATSVLRRPRELLRAFFSMNVVMLLVAIALIKIFPLTAPVRLTLVVLALSPVPPFLPAQQLRAGGERSYIYGLLVGMSLLSIVAVPLLVVWVGKLFDLEVFVPPADIAKSLLVTVLIPLGAGIFLRAWKPELSKRLAPMMLRLGNILLAVVGVLILVGAWRPMIALIGHETLVAILIFAIIGLIIGHLLGGPRPENRSSLALATSSRHPAVALAIAHATFPDQKQAPAAVLLYLISSFLMGILYLKWLKRRAGSSHEQGGWQERHA